MGTAGRDGGVRDMLRDLLRLETADGINRMNASSNFGHRDAEDWEPAHKLLATNTRAKDSLNARNQSFSDSLDSAFMWLHIALATTKFAEVALSNSPNSLHFPSWE